MKKQGRLLRRGLLLLCILCFLICGGSLLRYWTQTARTQRSVDELKQLRGQAEQAHEGKEAAEEDAGAAFAALRARNPDYAGWITIEGTGIDYPVMLPPEGDAEYYLHRGFDGEYDGNGLPFLDSRCSLSPLSGNLVIYGHNMRSGVMFHDLLSYRDEEFWREHPLITLETEDGVQTYEIFAALLYDASSDEDAFKPHGVIDFTSEEQFRDYLDGMAQAAYYDTGVLVTFGERILTLATCDRTLLSNGRMVVAAHQIA